ncbi:MAG: hypothetical protein NZ602_02590 [Thermoguttaceae bacterium]|nr:hypothetical protein [Thermoguttaceae bacterium]
MAFYQMNRAGRQSRDTPPLREKEERPLLKLVIAETATRAARHLPEKEERLLLKPLQVRPV